MARTLKIKAATIEEASRIYCEKRDASGLGGSRFPCGEWNGCHISYNGKVWNADTWPNNTLLFNPYAEVSA
jgi:hypothetical protein